MGELKEFMANAGGTVKRAQIQVDFYTKTKQSGQSWTSTWKPNFQKQSWNSWGNGKGKGKGDSGFRAPAFEVHHANGTVWIGNLPDGTKFEELKEHMSNAGGTVK